MKISNIPQSLIHTIPASIANYFSIIPKEKKDNVLYVYALKDLNNSEIEEVELLLDSKIEYEIIDAEVINQLLSKYYLTDLDKTKFINVSNDDNFLDNIIQEANNLNSSDIHFEIFENTARVRIRIDGVLIEKYVIKLNEYLELVNKIKIKANLDITEKRLPQDGRITNKNFDIRVSTLPTLFGEKIVLRILKKDIDNLRLEDLGFSKKDQELYLSAIKRSKGIVLISGPTGSGKTTTIYATLKLLNDIKRNILTIEDPIEYTLDGINQVQLKEDVGLTFTAALKSFLRQDPDIIMVGEIRDVDTAKMSIRAALTGHLVLSTIHTNSALGTISRLKDMGIPDFLIAETLNISVAQRLVRKLCNHCKKNIEFDKDTLPDNFKIPFTINEVAEPVGCKLCHYTGYKGRTAIYELLPISTGLMSHIKNNVNLAEEKYLSEHQKLSDKAFELLAKKTTSIEEIYDILLSS